MRDFLQDVGPMGWACLAVAVVVLVLLPTRLRGVGLVLGGVLAAVAGELAVAERAPRGSLKIDLTALHFALTAERRVLAGALLVVLAAPLGRAAGQALGRAGGLLGGLLTLGVYGAGLLTSGLWLRHGFLVAFALDDPAGRERLALVREAVADSTSTLTGAAIVAATAAVVLGLLQLRGARTVS